MRYPLIILGLLTLIVLTACGSSGSKNSGTDSNTNSEQPTETCSLCRGTFVDSPVQGLLYETDTLSGTTDLNGEFDYLPGETVEFFVGSISIGSGNAAAIMTPSDLTTIDGSENVYHKRNVIQFLQTLDDDGDPSNGILLREDIAEFTLGIDIDFDVTTPAFESDPGVLTVVRNATDVSHLINFRNAAAHYFSSLTSYGISLGAEQTLYVELRFNLDANETPPAIIGTNYTTNGSAIGEAQVGAGNGYIAEVATITLNDGTIRTVISAVNASAATTASQFSAIPGIATNPSTTAVLSAINDNGAMSITLNGVPIVDSADYAVTITAQDIAIAINNLSDTTLPGITAVNDNAAGTVTLTSNTGVDLAFATANSSDPLDGVTIAGATPRIIKLQGDGLGDVDVDRDGLIDAITEDNDGAGFSATVGGTIQFTFDQDIVMNTQQLIGGLDDGSGLFETIIPQAAFISNGFDPTTPRSYNHLTTSTIYDSIGSPHELSLYFIKESTIRFWTMYVQIDGVDVGDPNTAQPPPLDTSATPAAFAVLFNDDGSFNTTASQSIEISYWNPVDAQGQSNGSSQGLTTSARIALEMAGLTINPKHYSNFTINISNAQQLATAFKLTSVYEDSFVMEKFNSPVNRGIFVDSAVTGLGYQTLSQSGVTDANGEFDYMTGESIEFFVGNVSIGIGKADYLMTPSDLRSNSNKESKYHKRNVIQFLQTLDTDGDPSNGIGLREDIADFTSGHDIDFDAITPLFANDASALTIIRNATNVTELVTLDDAANHYFSTLMDFNINPLPEKTSYVELSLNVDSTETAAADIGTHHTTAGSSIGDVQVGSNNGYVAEVATFTLADSTQQIITTAANASIFTTASQFEAVPGVTVTSTTSALISSINDNGGLEVALNGIALVDSANFAAVITAQDIAIAINSLTDSTLPGITAINDNAQDTVTITSNLGVDLTLAVAISADPLDGITLAGTTSRIVQLQGNGLGDVDLNGDGIIDAITEDNDSAGFSATVGGSMQLTLSINIAIDTEQLIGAIDDGSGIFETNINQTLFILNGFNATDADTYNHSTTLEIFDSIGESHEMTLYFVKENELNTWTMHVQIDNLDVGAPNTGLPPPQDTDPRAAFYSLRFNNDGSLIASSDTIEITYWNPVDAQGEDNGAKYGLTQNNKTYLEVMGLSISLDDYSNFVINIDNVQQVASDFAVTSAYENSFSATKYLD